MTSSLESKGSCIDNNHSHFILVDDGTEGIYGGEIELRTKLQNYIAAIKIPKSKYVIAIGVTCKKRKARQGLMQSCSTRQLQDF